MPESLRRQILDWCARNDIPLAGFAPAGRWDNPPFEPWVPEEFRPRAIFPEAQSVIVLGLPVSLPVVDTAPSIHYHELYKTVNILLDQHGYRLAEWLTREGFPSVWIPRDGYGSITVLKEKPVAFFSHRHAAFLAGLGTFGINNVILTPQYGPRVRFVSILTAAGLPPDPVMEGSLCIHCMRCVKACPVHALDGEAYPRGLTEKLTCATRSEALNKRSISPCGLCIRACPVGADRERYRRQDPAMYDEADERYAPFHRAWKHTRAYGGR